MYYLYILVAWPLAVPIYFVWSRGRKGIWVAIGHTIGLLTTSMVGYGIAKLLR
ncbi:MAG: hypothetical protein GW893_13765 [Armatimonadetes bacterium]|nr:hypothetical protein [Armatimonadota bacterium]